MKILLFVVGAVVFAQSALNRPQLGVMVDSAGNARPLFGVAASVTAGDPVAQGVISSACAAGGCVLKMANALVAGGQTVAAPDGRALIALDGSGALIYFPGTGELARFQNGQLKAVESHIRGEIIGLRSSAGVAQFAVERSGTAWIVDQFDRALDSLPGYSSGPVMLFAGGEIYLSGRGVVLRRTDQSQIEFAAPGAAWFSAAAANYVQVHAGRRSYAVRTDPGREQIFELPEPAQ